MKPRCTGAKTPGHFTSFECVLDDNHNGFCEPYVAPTVDEWRAIKAMSAEAQAQAAAMRAVLEQHAEVRRTEHHGELHSSHQESAGCLCRWCMTGRALAPDADRARLQAELDALRAIVESGKGSP